MNFPRLLLFSMILTGCGVDEPPLKIEWKVGGILPAKNGENHIGIAGPVTGMVEDVLIIAGGANFPNGMPWEGGLKAYTKEAYAYTLNHNEALNLKHTFAFEDSLAYSANVSTGKIFYSIGGERKGQAIANVFRYTFNGNALQRSVVSSLPVALTSGAAAQIGNYIYFVGGENAEFVSDKVYRLNTEAGDTSVWEEYMTLPHRLSHAVVMSDGQSNLYIAGGRQRNANAKSTIYDDVYELNIADKQLNKITKLTQASAAGTGIYYDGNLVVIGGDNAQTFHQVEELIGAINVEKDAIKKRELIAKKNAIQSAHPGFHHEVWYYNLKSKTWNKTDSITAESPVTSTAILNHDMIIIPSGEIKAGVRTNQILIGRIK